MIAIILASYNGRAYIGEQIDSIFNQTRQDFYLYISDDGSNDGTPELIRSCQAKYPDRIVLHINEKNSGSAKYNFLDAMLKNVADDYFMLCDQDDVWLPDKIERSMQAMEAAEAEYGKETPLLVHTDLRVVDKDLQTMWDSFNEGIGIDPSHCGLEQLVVRNTLTGCTALYNKALAKCLRMPDFCVMHDGWLAQTAAAFGKIEYLPIPTVLYRQHGDNEIGAKRINSLTYYLNAVLHYQQIKKNLADTYRQAQSLLDVYGNALGKEQARFLLDYAAIPGYPSKLKRCKEIRRLRSLKSGILHRLFQFINA